MTGGNLYILLSLIMSIAPKVQEKKMSKIDHEIPEHAQTVLMPSELNRLKAVTGDMSTKDALRTAVEFTNKHYTKVMKAETRKEIQEMKKEAQELME